MRRECDGDHMGSAGWHGTHLDSFGEILRVLLGGSWVVISGVLTPLIWAISPLIWVISIITLLITPLITSHEPLSRP